MGKDCDTCKYELDNCDSYIGVCSMYNKWKPATDIRSYNVGDSDYAKYKIQPWDIWLEYDLNPWDADIIKRTLRTKDGENRTLDYEKIIHICKERIRQIDLEKAE